MEKKIIIAGPCSAETEEQVMKIASTYAGTGIIFRAGIWKPRTMPNMFEGVGSVGLKWLIKAREEFGLEIITEVASPEQVKEVRDAGFNKVWIGARTTTSPFSIDALAQELVKSDIQIFIKNPVNPDLSLWAGAVERFKNAGCDNLALIHRGFSTYDKGKYRNEPIWSLAFDMMAKYPYLKMIGDASHIAGTSTLIEELCGQFMSYGYDGLMVETHNDPTNALTDAEQQITPETFFGICQRIAPNIAPNNANLGVFRNQINAIDDKIISLLAERFELSEEIGKLKNSSLLFDKHRYSDLMGRLQSLSKAKGVDSEMVYKLYKIIHYQSVKNQTKICP